MFTPEVLIGLRWVHFVAGITWIGLLYWFNLVNVPFMKALDPAARPMVVPTLLPRALAWFRWSAVVTVGVGFLLIYGHYWQNGDFVDSDNAKTILVGGILGVIMLANVWGVIVPNQRKLFAAVAAGTAPDPAWARATSYASRTNFSLSFPLLFFMAGSAHYPLDWTGIVVVGSILAALGLATTMTVQKYWAARF